MSNAEATLTPEPDVIADIGASLRDFIEIDPADKEGRDEMLRRVEFEKRDLMAELVSGAFRLSAHTEWSMPMLLEWIGCDLDRDADIQTLSPRRLHNCERFIALLCEVAEAVSTLPNRRAVTVTFAELAQRLRRQADGLAPLLEVGDPSPWQYLRLGEISQAARAVQFYAQNGPPQGGDDPFAAERPVHVSTPRLDAYVSGDRLVLGDAVYDEIDRHLESCDACRAAAEYRRSRLGLP
jgi:hypothetical protein